LLLLILQLVVVMMMVAAAAAAASAMKTGGLEKLPMSSHLLHLRRRTHD
jgi:hypothetical protein